MHPLEDGLREARFPDFQAHLRSTRQHRRRPSPAPSAASTARGDQFEEIDPKDTKKADELNQQMAELAGKLGPEYIALVGGLQAMDPDSKGSKEINSTLDALDKLCAK
jgi:hypothetical protein